MESSVPKRGRRCFATSRPRSSGAPRRTASARLWPRSRDRTACITHRFRNRPPAPPGATRSPAPAAPGAPEDFRRLEQAVLARVRDELGPGTALSLLLDVGSVRLDGADAEKQLR